MQTIHVNFDLIHYLNMSALMKYYYPTKYEEILEISNSKEETILLFGAWLERKKILIEKTKSI